MVYKVNYFVNKFELFFHTFGQCCNLYRWQIWKKFLQQGPIDSSIVPNVWNPILPLYCFGPGESLSCHFSWTLWVFQPESWTQLWTKKVDPICRGIFKVHIVGFTEFVQWDCSGLSHGVYLYKKNAGSWKKWLTFQRESQEMTLVLHIVAYERVFLGHGQVMFPYLVIVTW